MTATSVADPGTTAVPPLPDGFRLIFDPSMTEPERGVLVGGQPMRLLRLSDSGVAALDALRAGRIHDRVTGTLARRLTDAGLAHPVPPEDAEVADLTVVVPVRDRAAALDRCLTALGRELPVIVVDDGSTDLAGTAAVAGQHGASLVVLPINAGPAAARNVGIAAATTPLVALVDSDTSPTAQDLRAVARHLVDPAVSAAAPRIVAVAGNSVAGRFARARCALDLGGQPCLVWPYRRVSYVPTAVLVARRDVLFEQSFDETMRVGEDVDLVWRLVSSGHRVRYAPEVDVRHEEPSTWRGLLGRRFRYGTSAAPLARRHPDNVAPFIINPAFTGGVIAAVAGRPRAAAVLALGALGQVDGMVRRAGLPRRRRVAGTAQGLRQTYLGLGRWLTQCIGPLLVLAVVRGHGRTRAAGGLLLAGAVLAAEPRSRGDLPLVAFAFGALADDMTYGAGVLAGCLRARTLRPMMPHLTDLEITR